MTNMFNFNFAFNGDITNWNVSKVVYFIKTFYLATAFNQNIGAWNVSKCTNFSFMFGNATAFNNNGSSAINNWSINPTSSVIFDTMFYNATAFNQPIGNWNVSKVTSMANMFVQASSFTQPLANWERVTPDISTTGNVTNMSAMFQSTPYNSSINNWDVSKVTDFGYMFSGATLFNQPLNSWTTSAMIVTAFMFSGASTFNQPLGNWNVSNLVITNSMFQNAILFNQPLANWERSTLGNVSTMSKVIDINSMFNGATAFQQYIGNWNLKSLGNGQLQFFMYTKTPTTFPSIYLDDIYSGWIQYKLPTTAATLTNPLNFGTAKYTSAATQGRSLLTRPAALLSITNIDNNGSGLIRITATAHGLVTSNKAFIYDVTGTTEANGLWTITYVSANTFDLQGSTFTNAYVSGGSLRTGYGWTITDGGI